jgi:hypothetical protein
VRTDDGCHAEIRDLELVVLVQKQILGFEIAVTAAKSEKRFRFVQPTGPEKPGQDTYQM